MKKLYRRSISGLMALLICFTTILGGCITAFAASSSGEVAKSYSIGFPRSGDANLDYSGTWGHDELHYMNGWTSGEATWMTTLHTIGSFDGPACYCIEPGVPRLLEKTYTRYGEDYTGTEKYAIVTDLSYAQIMERYAPVAEHYCPFLLLSKAAGEVIADFKRNEDKFSKRMQKDACYSFEDGTTERYNIECCIPDFTEALFRECFPQRLVEKAFSLLTPIQQSRVKQHIFGKKSFAKIAASEGKAKNTIQESYDAAIKKMKKFLKNTLPKDTPYSE